MNLAIININTHIVENVIVPPQGSDAYFIGNGFYGVYTDIGGKGDTYSIETQEFTKPTQGE